MRKSEWAFNADWLMMATAHQRMVFDPQGALQVSPRLTALLQVLLQSPQAHFWLFSSADQTQSKHNKFLPIQRHPLALLPRSFLLLWLVHTFSECRLLTSPIIRYIVASKRSFKTHRLQEAFPDCPNSTLMLYYLVSISRCAFHSYLQGWWLCNQPRVNSQTFQ